MLVMFLSFVSELKHIYNFHEQDFGGYLILGKIPRQKLKFSKQDRQRNKQIKTNKQTNKQANK